MSALPALRGRGPQPVPLLGDEVELPGLLSSGEIGLDDSTLVMAMRRLIKQSGLQNVAFLKPREVLIAGAVSFLRSLVVSAADLLFCLWISIGSSLSTRCGEARIFDGLQSPLIGATAGLTSLLHAAFGRTPVNGRRCRVGCANRLVPTVVPLLLSPCRHGSRDLVFGH